MGTRPQCSCSTILGQVLCYKLSGKLGVLRIAVAMSRLSLILVLALAEGFAPATVRCRRAAPRMALLESAMTGDVLFSASELGGNMLVNKLAPALGVAATAGATCKAAAHAVLSARDATQQQRRQRRARRGDAPAPTSYEALEALDAARLGAGAEDSEEIVPLDAVQHLALASALALNVVALYGLSFDPVADALAGRVARLPFEASGTSAFSEQRLQINQEYEEMLRTYRAEQAEAELQRFAPCEQRVSLQVDSLVEM